MPDQRTRGRPRLRIPDDTNERWVWAAALVTALQPRRGELHALCREVAGVFKASKRDLATASLTGDRRVLWRLKDLQKGDHPLASRYRTLVRHLTTEVPQFLAWSWLQMDAGERAELAHQVEIDPADMPAAVARHWAELDREGRRTVLRAMLAEALRLDRDRS